MARTLVANAVEQRPPILDAGEAYDAHADFVWASLHRLGVAQADLPDLLQEVFVVVHRRRRDFDPARPIRAWLWGIAVGLVRNYRRRAHRLSETMPGSLPERRAPSDPERELDARRRRATGARVLSELDPEKRAVFVMFEVEGMSGKAIAELLDVPLGTVHSRLHGARRALAEALSAEEDA